ncbi:hypothetical protein GCM10010911_49900 [Paenibacillus nasutitermitis]|uniref:WCX domain-containing protein n=1 Tax=Paenibacillus nasutitermitis TaxID=1652958 RepID=A0A916ZB18_9BACL|nr:hypothetical protein GCM10010911_49900 [Paenibacillus nasutitermitis]
MKDWNAPELLKMEKTALTVNLTPNGVRAFESSSFGDSIDYREDGSGTAHILVPIDNLSFFVNLIWGLGEDAEILEPAEAVDFIKRKIEKIKNIYE